MQLRFSGRLKETQAILLSTMQETVSSSARTGERLLSDSLSAMANLHKVCNC
jgi:hypothetical protein